MSPSAVHAYVEPKLRASFEEYRKQCGLASAAALLGLLIFREIKLKRLKASGQAPRSDRTTRVGRPGTRSAKISTKIDGNVQGAFTAYAEGLGNSASGCAAMLAERELAERWLLKALEWSPGQ